MASVGDWSGSICAVTGGCGGYGAFLVRALVKAGAHVRVLDLRRDDHIDFLSEAEQAGTAKFISCNLCSEDLSSVRDALQGVSVVFHTVAFFGDPAFTSNDFANPGHADKMRAINVTCVGNVTAVARECGVKAFVHTSSTNTLFSSRASLVDITEEAPYPKPSECIDLYSVTKAEAERLVIGMNGTGGMFTASIRPNGIYGPSERSYGVLQMLERLAPMRGLFVRMLNDQGKEPLVDWCHVENLALVQMLVAKQMLAANPKVCGNIFHASDDVVSTMSEFFGPMVRGAGWTVKPLFSLPGGLLRGIAYSLEATCYFVRKLTGWRGVVPPLNRVEAAKITFDNYQNIDKVKRELGFVAIPQSELMKGMAIFSRAWAEKKCAIPSAPFGLWAAIVGGGAATMLLSFVDVRRMNGAPWKFLRTLCSSMVPSVSSMQLDVFQRKVLRTGICLPMLAIHFVDSVLAAHLARRQGHHLWMTYALRTLILGNGQLSHLLPPNSGGVYGLCCVTTFSLFAVVATKMR